VLWAALVTFNSEQQLRDKIGIALKTNKHPNFSRTKQKWGHWKCYNSFSRTWRKSFRQFSAAIAHTEAISRCSAGYLNSIVPFSLSPNSIRRYLPEEEDGDSFLWLWNCVFRKRLTTTNNRQRKQKQSWHTKRKKKKNLRQFIFAKAERRKRST
jgi:hypothetical protein